LNPQAFESGLESDSGLEGDADVDDLRERLGESKSREEKGTLIPGSDRLQPDPTGPNRTWFLAMEIVHGTGRMAGA